MASPAKALNGLRILVVEDNFLAAEVIRVVLEDNGYTVVGPVGRVDDGVRLAEAEALDGAVLDVNLNGDRCFPIAETLRGRGVPFMFLTGYDSSSIPAELRDTQRLGKPILEQQLIDAIGDLLAG
ncbi:CheY chemotaxis protein or a CheY-like REC (receiver) domain [Rhodospirillales bacterium URHD0017]|nr:CheY chemotaxis protein or a CheY-like REC (receiver) domain [Rhodospirillales bacterium URHD0017]